MSDCLDVRKCDYVDNLGVVSVSTYMEDVHHRTSQNVHDIIKESDQGNKVDEITDVREEVNSKTYHLSKYLENEPEEEGIIDAHFYQESLNKLNDEDDGK